MNLIVRLNRLIKKNKGEYCVLDTSVISNYPTILEELIDKGIKIIVPEGVHHELSVSLKTKAIYKSIMDNDKITVLKTNANMRSWAVDEQVVETTYMLYKKGYNVKLITCDKDQAYKAKKLNGLNVELVPVENKRNKNEFEQLEEIKPEDVISLKSIVKGKEMFISIKYGISVFSNKGKRKIGKGKLIPIQLTDIFDCQGYKYSIQDVSNNLITLKKLNIS